MNKNKRNQAIAQEYSDTPITVLEIATNYGISAAEVIKNLSAQLGDRYRELVELKRQQNHQGANTMSDNNFFHVGDKVQWTNAEGDRVIGVISQMFTKKCWLKPAGSDRVGEIITGVSLEEIELYSSEPGPIEVALAELKSSNCQTRQLSEWQPGDRVKFFDEDTNHWISGELDSIEEESDYCTVSTPAGEIWFTLTSQLKPAEAEENPNCQNRQLSDSVELVELDESVEENNCQDRQFDEIPETDEDSETFWLPLEAIAEHSHFQPRGRNWQTQDKGIDSDVVSQYTDWLEFSEPPALEVWFGELEGEEKYWLLAGHHRIRALRKAGRENVECFQWAVTYEEAIYRASTSNAGGGNRTRQIHKMQSAEWSEACKSFLRVCDKLSPEVIQEFLNEAAALTRQTRKWPRLNNMAIAAVFGISPASVIEYKKQIKMERLADKFPMGTRVLLVNYSEIFLLEKREHRLGRVDVFNPTKGVMVKFDSCRAKDGYFHPNDLKVVDDPLPEQHSFKVGDKVWNEQAGVVVAVSPDNSPKNIWSVYLDITELTPLVCWDNGYHQVVEKMDYDGPGETLSVEQRLNKLSDYLESIKDDSTQNWKISNAKDQIKYLQSLVNPSEVQPETTTIKQEEKQKRQEVLGRSTPAGGGGSGGAELPDVSGVNGKHPENPQTTAVGVLERPAEATNLKQAQIEARRSAARNALANVKLDLEVLPDDDLKEILKAAKAELTRRHRPQQEGDPERRLELEIA
ncbi:ParB/Srx family N-terminal domain-containing protein [Laspinema olomoucense]|uniref:ParB/Srx family N-terminal domain-containing protein n=1 Tax=Laspinema olomoucense TaxID=3231600 RepID=UPI0021BA841A|nr:ParB/Srx family N-terminal domain-containing protein [Laspinema sp. D3d]MCT7975252.1 ParB/Srx family N-terminal domain-containing protein [Laspinema sp. D3d]